MKETTFLLEAEDGAKIHVRRWSPDGDVLAVVQLVHGMAEHSARYARLASLLCGAGVEVLADDHRGHGLTADPAVNDPGKGGKLGHCADRNGFERVVLDLFLLTDRIHRERHGKPLFLLGHSWGSFLAQSYIERDATRLSGCILSGTRGKGGAEVALGSAVAAAIAAVGGARRHSRLVWSLADGPYNKAFAPNRTPFDWLSRDEAEVDAYVADPLCGVPCSVGFYRDLTRGLSSIHRKEAMARIPKELPVFVFAGSADPVGSMGASPSRLVEDYRALGLRDLEFVLYPEARHETLNETNRDEVSAAVLEWIRKRLP